MNSLTWSPLLIQLFRVLKCCHFNNKFSIIIIQFYPFFFFCFSYNYPIIYSPSYIFKYSTFAFNNIWKTKEHNAIYKYINIFFYGYKKKKSFLPSCFHFFPQTMFYMRYNFVLNKHFYNIFFYFFFNFAFSYRIIIIFFVVIKFSNLHIYKFVARCLDGGRDKIFIFEISSKIERIIPIFTINSSLAFKYIDVTYKRLVKGFRRVYFF